jgi:hypothetical protein
MKLIRALMALAAAAALVAVDGTALAQPREKDKERKEHKEQKERAGADGKEKKVKQHKHKNGKALLGERVKKNGKHKLEAHGKHVAYANVKDGKITGLSVEHAEKGAVPVKKYKTSKKMAQADGMLPVSLHLVQAYSVGSTWIGYAYIDDWGDEVIYWYEYEMIYDGDTGAVEYVPVY